MSALHEDDVPIHLVKSYFNPLLKLTKNDQMFEKLYAKTFLLNFQFTCIYVVGKIVYEVYMTNYAESYVQAFPGVLWAF